MQQDRILEKELFELLEKMGETITGDTHVLDTSEEYGEEGYRVYLKEGICFDVKKEHVCDKEDVHQFDGVDSEGYNYSFYAEWDDFPSITCETALGLIKTKITKTLHNATR